MDDDFWLRTSMAIRLEHEFVHYLTKRLYGCMNRNLLDEIICDWAGLTVGLGRFEARWFSIFLGLEDWPQVKPGGRVHAYRGNLDAQAFKLMCAVTVQAANGLELLARGHSAEPADRLRWIVTLTRLTLELLACEERERAFAQAWARAGRLLGG